MNFLFLFTIILHMSAHQCVSVRNRVEREIEVITTKKQPGVPAGWTVLGNDPVGDATCRSSHCEAAFRCWEGVITRCCWSPENDDECGRPGLPYGWSAPGNDPAGEDSCHRQYCEEAFRSSNGWTANCCWTEENHDKCHEHKGFGCLPSNVKVMLEDGKSVAMSELQVGDRVKTVSEEGRLMYSEIRTFLHKDDATTGLYVKIKTAANNTIFLSGTHLIYATKNHNDKFSPMYAYDVIAANHLLVQKDDKLLPEMVIDVSSILIQGVYAPLTADGNIIVQGVLTSCYASFDHDLAHFTMTPMQWYPEIIRWIFGVTKSYPGYVSIAKEVGRWILV